MARALLGPANSATPGEPEREGNSKSPRGPFMKRIERRRFRRTCGIGLAAVAAGGHRSLFASGIQRTNAQASGPTMTVPNLAVRAAVDRIRDADRTCVSLRFAVARDREEHGEGPGGGEWCGHRHRARPGGQQLLGAGTSRDRSPSRLRGEQLRLPLLELRRSPAARPERVLPDGKRVLPDARARRRLGPRLAVPLLGNRVDRFVWNDATNTLAFDINLIMLRSFQNDASTSPTGPNGEIQPPRGNHDGGVIRFGPDGKLYIQFGDVGRRGQLQNLPSGPTLTGLGDIIPDDQFGGPRPDDAHFTGVIIRLNDDGTTPTDNPFFSAGAAMGGEEGENIQKIFAYGVRNGFGMAFDPLSGNLWDQENGEDAFDEINLIEPGMNSGWIQIMGPASRVAQFKQIETTSLHHEDFPNLQQFRWGPERIADTPAEALSRLFVLPGSHYSDPEYSWKFVLAPAAIGFLDSRALGPQWFGDLFVGFSVNDDPLGGGLMAFELTTGKPPRGSRGTRRRQRDLPRPEGEQDPNRRNELRHRHRYPDGAERESARRVAGHRDRVRNFPSEVKFT